MILDLQNYFGQNCHLVFCFFSQIFLVAKFVVQALTWTSPIIGILNKYSQDFSFKGNNKTILEYNKFGASFEKILQSQILFF